MRALIRQYRLAEWLDIAAYPIHDCHDCGIPVAPIDYLGRPLLGRWHWFMVHADVWAASGLSPHGGYLCVPCLELRIGRVLAGLDFTDWPVNEPDDLDTPYLWALKAAR